MAEEAAKANDKGNEKGKRRRKRSKSPKDDETLSLAEDLNLDRVGRDHSSDSDLLDSDRSADEDDREMTNSQFLRRRKR